MPEQTKLLLSDPAARPDDKILAELTGSKWTLWQDIMNFCTSQHPGSAGEWNFYNDGKQWLFKMVRKKKTLFWSGITEDGFVVTFYFGDKAEPEVMGSTVSQGVKDRFMLAKRYGAIRGVSFNMVDPSEPEDIKRLIDLKVKLK